MQFEIGYPAPDDERHLYPAFSPTGDKSPFQSHEVYSIFSNILVAVMGKEQSIFYSLHSFRITLACVMLMCDKSDAAIQCMCRWKTQASVLHYAKLTPHAYADNVDLVTQSDATDVFGHPLPPTGPEDIVNDIVNAIDQLEADPAPDGSRASTSSNALSSAPRSASSGVRRHPPPPPNSSPPLRRRSEALRAPPAGAAGFGHSMDVATTSLNPTLLPLVGGQAPPDLRPLTNRNASGRRVWVDAAVYAGVHECDVNNGKGWFAKVTSLSRGVVSLKFEPSPDGTQWAATRLRVDQVCPA